jgi:hypothetical protein
MLPLLAFPTQLVWDKFRPVRGFSITHAIPVWDLVSDFASINQKSAFLDIVASEFGYDAELLAEGEGETGVPGHHWVAYGTRGVLPQLIRWTPGKGNVLVTYDHGIPGFLHRGPWIIMQADREALTETIRLVSAFNAAHVEGLGRKAELSDVVAHIASIPPESHGFTRTSVLQVIDPDKPGLESCVSEIADYIHSTNLEFLTAANCAKRAKISDSMIRQGDRIIIFEPKTDAQTVLHLQSGEPLPPSASRLIHQESLADTTSLMQETLEKRWSQEFGNAGLLSAEIDLLRTATAEAKAAHDSRFETLEGLKASWTSGDIPEVYFSEQFTYPVDHDPAIPLSEPSTKGPRHDLLSIGLEFAIGEDCPVAPSADGESDILAFLATSINKEVVRQLLSEVDASYSLMRKPHMTVFKGLPVKVDRELTVCRKHMRHGLTLQYAKVSGPNGKRGVVFSRLLRHLQA